MYYPTGAPTPTDRPTGAMILSIIGGVFILLGGLAEVAIGSFVSAFSFGVVGGSIVLFGALGVILGILIIVFGVMIHQSPQHHAIYGAIVLVLAIVSLTSFLGGFILGFILALIGGILGIVWKPTMVFQAAPAVQRVCPKCGRVVDPNVKFCPHCGAGLP
ncbi:MAG: DUF6114 domain-containing protein [Thermoplasmata archaeon]